MSVLDFTWLDVIIIVQVNNVSVIYITVSHNVYICESNAVAVADFVHICCVNNVHYVHCIRCTF